MISSEPRVRRHPLEFPEGTPTFLSLNSLTTSAPDSGRTPATAIAQGSRSVFSWIDADRLAAARPTLRAKTTVGAARSRISGSEREAATTAAGRRPVHDAKIFEAEISMPLSTWHIRLPSWTNVNSSVRVAGWRAAGSADASESSEPAPSRSAGSPLWQRRHSLCTACSACWMKD